MPFDGSGVYDLPAAPIHPAVTGTTIDAAKHNALMEDIAEALSNCLTKDGQQKLLAYLDFNGFNVEGAAPATADGQFVTYQQVSALLNVLQVVDGDGTTDNTAAVQAAAESGRPTLFLGVNFCNTATTFTAPILNGPEHIFDISAKLTFATGQDVWPDWFGDVEEAVLTAINSLPATGGRVRLLPKAYKPSTCGTGAGIITKNGVHLCGTTRPSCNASLTQLGNGSIVQGKLAFSGNSIKVSDVGFDCGASVITSFYSGFDTAVDFMPTGGSWGGLQFYSSSEKSSVVVENCCALLQKPTTLGSGLQVQGYKGFQVLGGFETFHGHEPFKLMCKEFWADSLKCKQIGGYGLTLKAGSYHIDTLEAYKSAPNYSPSSTESVEASVLFTDNSAGAGVAAIRSILGTCGSNATALKLGAASGTFQLSIDSAEVSGASKVLEGKSEYCQQPFIGILKGSGADGIIWGSSETVGDKAGEIHFGKLLLNDCPTNYIQLVDNGALWADLCECEGAFASYAEVFTLTSTSRVYIGRSGKKLRESADLTSTAGNFTARPSGTFTNHAAWFENYGVRLQFSSTIDSNSGTRIASLLSQFGPLTSKKCTAVYTLNAVGASTFYYLTVTSTDIQAAGTVASGGEVDFADIWWPQ